MRPPRPALLHHEVRAGVVAVCLLLGVHAANAGPDSPDPIGAPVAERAPARAVEPAAAQVQPRDGALAQPPLAPAAGIAAQPPLLRQVRDRAAEMVFTALRFVGVRYRRGGDSEAGGFDCSGFTRHVFAHLGIALPRRVDEQASAPGLVAVQRADLRPGDLVFFNTLRRTFSHVGIYIGENRFVHAPRPGGEVRTENLGAAYWAHRYTGARRAESGAGSPLDQGPTAQSTAAIPGE
jgi:cell wall-associated NlpC family hydrolase